MRLTVTHINRASHFYVDLGWVDFDFCVPPSCPAAQPLLPNSHQPKQSQADSETLEIQVNKTQSKLTWIPCTSKQVLTSKSSMEESKSAASALNQRKYVISTGQAGDLGGHRRLRPDPPILPQPAAAQNGGGGGGHMKAIT